MVPEHVPEPRTVKTAGGRVAGYYEFGDPDGTPVVAMHGTPACGAGFVWADEAARARGLRIVAPDRPGIGLSDLTGRGRVADYVPEFRAFADALGLDEFHLLGYSGGGPYALAVAHAEPERVHACAIVAGAGQVGAWTTVEEFERTDRQMTRLSMRVPVAARSTLAFSARFARVAPRASLLFARLEMPDPDRRVIDRFPNARAALAVFTQATKRTSAGVVHDYAELGRPWGFPVEEISVPVRCWHATADTVVAPQMTDELAARVPGARVDRWDGEGHLAIVEHVGDVLDGLTELTDR